MGEGDQEGTVTEVAEQQAAGAVSWVVRLRSRTVGSLEGKVWKRPTGRDEGKAPTGLGVGPASGLRGRSRHKGGGVRTGH